MAIQEFEPDYSLWEQMKISFTNLAYHVSHPFDKPKQHTDVYKAIPDTKTLNKELYSAYEAAQATIIDLQKQLQDYEKHEQIAEAIDIEEHIKAAKRAQREFHEQLAQISFFDLLAFAHEGKIQILSKDGVAFGTWSDFIIQKQGDSVNYIVRVIPDGATEPKDFYAYSIDSMFHHFETLPMQLNNGYAHINYYHTGEFVEDLVKLNPENLKREHLDKILKENQQQMSVAQQKAREEAYKYRETLEELNNTKDQLEMEKKLNKETLKTTKAFKDIALEAQEGVTKLVRDTSSNLTARVAAQARQSSLAETVSELSKKVTDMESTSTRGQILRETQDLAELLMDIQNQAPQPPALPPQPGNPNNKRIVQEEVIEEDAGDESGGEQ